MGEDNPVGSVNDTVLRPAPPPGPSAATTGWIRVVTVGTGSAWPLDSQNLNSGHPRRKLGHLFSRRS